MLMHEIARHALGHNEVEIAYGNQPTPMIDDPVGRSADNLAKVTAEETETKRGALKDAKNAVSEADKIRKDIGIELDKAQAKLPKAVQEQRAVDVQTYKDTLAMQEVRWRRMLLNSVLILIQTQRVNSWNKAAASSTMRCHTRTFRGPTSSKRRWSIPATRSAHRRSPIMVMQVLPLRSVRNSQAALNMECLWWMRWRLLTRVPAI